MKSTIKNTEVKDKEITFPCLMQHNSTKDVWLYISKLTAILLHKDAESETRMQIGTTENVNMLDTYNMTPFTGTIELSND